jgi:hypothetical protein
MLLIEGPWTWVEVGDSAMMSREVGKTVMSLENDANWLWRKKAGCWYSTQKLPVSPPGRLAPCLRRDITNSGKAQLDVDRRLGNKYIALPRCISRA